MRRRMVFNFSSFAITSQKCVDLACHLDGVSSYDIIHTLLAHLHIEKRLSYFFLLI